MSGLMKFAGTALKNLFSKPVTTEYPFKPKEYFANTRGHVEIVIDNCIMCGICSKACPSDAIVVDRKKNEWTINSFDCVQCGYCAIKCPKKCLSIVAGYRQPDTQKIEEKYVKIVEEAPKYPIMDESKCVYCTLCARKCPETALEVDRKEKSWKLIKEKCASCGLCVSGCPKKCIEMK